MNVSVLQDLQNTNPRIRRAQQGEEQLIIDLLVEAAEWMEEKKSGRWRKTMFTSELIHRYFAEREVYVAESDGEPAGMFTLQLGDEEYWDQLNDKEYYYLHRLNVRRKFRSQNIGTFMLDWAVQYTQQQGKKGLRLDCLADLLPLNHFYQRHDFRYMGTREVGGSQASLYEKLPPVQNHEIRLQYFTRKDFDLLLHWSAQQDERFLLQWSGPEWNYPLQTTDLESYIIDANHPDRSDKLMYTAVDRKSNQPIGHLALTRIDRRQRSLRISRVLIGEPDARGKGYGRKMMQEALRISFEALGMNSVTLGVLDFNKSALGLYDSLGFQQEEQREELVEHGDQQYKYGISEMRIQKESWQANKQ